MPERLFREVKRGTRVVGMFPNEVSASTLATEIVLRSGEEWALRRCLTMDAKGSVWQNGRRLRMWVNEMLTIWLWGIIISLVLIGFSLWKWYVPRGPRDEDENDRSE